MKQYSDLIPVAKKLRRTQTEAEKILWSNLRNNQLGYKFRRQYPIDPYVADFVCFEEHLIIELDGGQHTAEKDAQRTAYLEQKGYKILRIWNNELFDNLEGVGQTILNTLNSTPSPAPLRSATSPDGRGKEA